MASRFVETDVEFIEELRNTSENKNTKRSTDYWPNIFQLWAKPRGKTEQLESYGYGPRGSKSASGYGPGGPILGGSKSARTPAPRPNH